MHILYCCIYTSVVTRTLEQGQGLRGQGPGPRTWLSRTGQGLSYSPANSNLFVKHIKHAKQSHFVTSECPLFETTFCIEVHCTSEKRAFLIVSHSCDYDVAASSYHSVRIPSQQGRKLLECRLFLTAVVEWAPNSFQRNVIWVEVWGINHLKNRQSVATQE